MMLKSGPIAIPPSTSDEKKKNINGKISFFENKKNQMTVGPPPKDYVLGVGEEQFKLLKNRIEKLLREGSEKNKAAAKPSETKPNETQQVERRSPSPSS